MTTDSAIDTEGAGGAVTDDATATPTGDNQQIVPPMSRAVVVSSVAQLVGSAVLVVLMFLEWIPSGRTGWSRNGGSGFGLLALVTALVTAYAAVQGLRGCRRETRIVGPNQLAFGLALATFTSNLVFLWVFTTGGAPKWVYVVSNVLILAGVVGLFSSTPQRPATLPDAAVRRLGVATVVLGVAIAAAPMLNYTVLSSATFTGYEPGSPRVGVLMIIIAIITVLYGLERSIRTNALHEIGRYVLWPHVTMLLGGLAAAPALCWLITGWWGSAFTPGIGVYASVGVGAALVGLGVFEAVRRNAAGV